MEAPVRKMWAQAYAKNDLIVIDTQSGYRTAALDPQGKRHILDSTAAEGAIGAALLDALANSRFLTPDEARSFFQPDAIKRHYEAWVHELLKALGCKTRRELFGGMKCCNIQCVADTIVIEPWHHKKLELWTGDGITEHDWVRVPRDSPSATIGNALKVAFSRCT